jgi:hypothetical protein
LLQVLQHVVLKQREQRQLLNSLVGLYARQSGEPHGAVHAELARVEAMVAHHSLQLIGLLFAVLIGLVAFVIILLGT